MSEKEAEVKEGEAAAPKKSKKMLFIIIIAVVVLLAGGGVASFALMSGGEEKDAEHHEEVELEPVLKTAKLDTFIVNLSEANAFLKVTMLLEYDQNILDKLGGQGEGGGHGYGGGGAGGGGGADPLALPAQMKAREPMLRDAIIRVISSKRTSDVISPDGKDKLKEEIIEVVNEAIGLEEPPVVNVYFMDFIIQ